MPYFLRVALVVITSLVSAVTLAFVISAIEIQTDLALYGLSVAFVIPVGAIGCGFVAAVGYYAASRELHVRPTPALMSIPLVTAVVTFVASHYFSYQRYEFAPGRTLSEVMGFGEYLRAAATETSLSFGSSGSVDRLGTAGYAVTAIEIVGFAVGGWLVASHLRSKPWCSDSGQFMKRVEQRKQMFEEYEPFQHAVVAIGDQLEHGNARGAIGLLPEKASSFKENRKATLSVEVDCYECRACGAGHSVVTTQERKGNQWHQTNRSEIHPAATPGHVQMIS